MTDQQMPTPPNAGYASYNQPRPPLASGLARTVPVYNEQDTPPPQSTGTMPARTTALAHLDTTYLNRAQKDLRSNIPSDPTFLAHVGALLRALIGHELSSPDRIAADKDAADRAAAETAARQKVTMAERHEAEVAATPPEQHDDLAAKHAEEVAAVDRAHALEALSAKQVEDRKEFDRIQAEQRAAIV
jgi:hypothetical protein